MLLVLLHVQLTARKPFLQKPKRLLLRGIHAVGERPQEQDNTSHNKGNKKERAAKYQPQHRPHHPTAHHATQHSHALLKHLLHILLHCRSGVESYHIAPHDIRKLLLQHSYYKEKPLVLVLFCCSLRSRRFPCSSNLGLRYKQQSLQNRTTGNLLNYSVLHNLPRKTGYNLCQVYIVYMKLEISKTRGTKSWE